MLTLSDIIAIAFACKLWSVISDILADFVVEWKNSFEKPVDNSKTVDIINNLPPAHPVRNNIPTSVPPPRKQNIIDVNIKIK